jgi:hypothetical protein
MLPQILAEGQAVSYTVLVNQTATHAVPAVLNSVSAALLRGVLGDAGAQLPVTNHPLPTLSREAAIAVSRETGERFNFRNLDTCFCWTPPTPPHPTSPPAYTVKPHYKRWVSVAELTCHLQGSTPYGIRFSHKNLQAVAD